jgi:hypothetical protein
MRGPKPLPITLTSAERADLEALVRRHTAPQQLDPIGISFFRPVTPAEY